MQITSLAIVGTAGRKDDRNRLTKETYKRMCDGVLKLLKHERIDPRTLKIISGGAAWADHVPVTLAIDGIINPSQLTIYTPAEYRSGEYVSKNKYPSESVSSIYKNDPSEVANFYHKIFSQKVGIDSIGDLGLIEKMGATLTYVEGGFKNRNTKVASSVNDGGMLVAFTFGVSGHSQEPWTIRRHDGHIGSIASGLKPGGTADTWDKATCVKFHAKLGTKDTNDQFF